MSIQTPKAFTVEYQGHVNSLQTKCGVSKHFDQNLSKEKTPEIENFTGIWDTGATNSVISKNVIDKLGLIPTGIGKVHHAGGESIVNTYLPSTRDFDFVKEYNDMYHKPLVKDKIPGRNDPCHCGSGKKYKNCHGK